MKPSRSWSRAAMHTPWAEWRRLAPFATLEAELAAAKGTGPALDLGCGTGFWLTRIAAAGVRPVGAEADPRRALEASAHAPVVVADGARLPLGDGSVGLVWCLHVLHHAEDPCGVLAEARRVLRPGGRLLLAESVEDNPAIRLVRSVWPAWEGMPVRSRFSAAELGVMVRAGGFEVEHYRHHTPLSFAGLVPPRHGRHLWAGLRGVEHRLGGRLDRWGAYVDCVARASLPAAG